MSRWRFRRSLNFGPLRFNFSRSGIGTSVGGRGYRVGVDAKGRQYRSLSIPGTGIYRRDYANKAGKIPNQALGIVLAFMVFALFVLFFIAVLWSPR